MVTEKYHTSDLSKNSFLVTGGAGFIGANLVAYLLMNGARKVRVLDNLSTGFSRNIETFFSHPSFEFIDGDICNADVCARACSGIDFISHQAALGSVPRSINDPAATHQHNVNGFLNMILAARDAKVKTFVYASSSSVYGDSKELPKTEDKIGNPLSPYAVTKLVNELYAHVFAINYKMNVIGLRYFNVFGPKQDPYGPYAAVIPLFINSLLNNESPHVHGDGEQTRDFTFVDNAVQANILAMLSQKHEAFNNVYNIAVGERVSVNHLFETVAQLLGSPVVAKHGPDRAGDIRDSLADISLAKKLLGYSPAVSLRDGLQKTIAWHKEKISSNAL